MTIKLKKVFANLFYVITVLFFILVALNAPQKSNVDLQSDLALASQSEGVAALTEFFTNSNLN